MKILLIYYTGTYNTRYLTDQAQNLFLVHGHSVERVEIKRDTPVVCTEGFDLIGFGYPIYGFNSPLPFNRYIRKLNLSAGQKFFIYKNSGETFAVNNASSRILLRLMKKRKAVLAGEYHFVMPYNIHFAFNKNFVREILDKDFKLLKIMCKELEAGIVRKIPEKRIYRFASAVVSVQKAGGAVNSFFYRADMNSCIRCMKCVRDCPENNIRFEKGKIRFGHHCDMCMRCSFFCPANAIHIGLLEGWKVNGDYHLHEIEQMPLPEKSFIHPDTRGFYRCYLKTFEDIEKEYARLFPNDNHLPPRRS